MTETKKISPQRIVLRHLSGSKASQVEEFPLEHFQELLIGRDPSVAVKYDPDRDDLVSRQHAKIVPHATDPTQFTITDLGSRNGTYLNKQRIIGTVKLTPGDVIELGPGGPEFQFDLEPRPESMMRPTRIASPGAETAGAQKLPPTRVSDTPSQPPAPAPPASIPTPVGKTTVMRMMTQVRSQSQKYMIIGGVALVVLIALVAGIMTYRGKQIQQQAVTSSQSAIRQTEEMIKQAEANRPLTPKEIAAANTSAVVFIEAGWKLIYTPSGGQLYHQYIPNQYKDKEGNRRPIVPDGRRRVAVYVQVGQGDLEPKLTLDGKGNDPIGGSHTGSGFTVTSDGFILTNRHVAANWMTSYHFDRQAAPGVILTRNGRIALRRDGRPVLVQPPQGWVPAKSKQVGFQLEGSPQLEGRNDFLNVTFAKNKDRNKARLVRVSDRHDVAMIKVDLPTPVTKVELNDNYNAIKPGDASIVLGYPGVSPAVVGVIRSEDVFNREATYTIVPDPTVSVGHVGRVLRGQGLSSNKEFLVSLFRDAYQLTINSTGPGNSGGPVFDDHGRVVGIFFAGKRGSGGELISFAVPIRYGMELMGVKPVMK